jgi:hypothetical protein
MKTRVKNSMIASNLRNVWVKKKLYYFCKNVVFRMNTLNSIFFFINNNIDCSNEYHLIIKESSLYSHIRHIIYSVITTKGTNKYLGWMTLYWSEYFRGSRGYLNTRTFIYDIQFFYPFECNLHFFKWKHYILFTYLNRSFFLKRFLYR